MRSTTPGSQLKHSGLPLVVQGRAGHTAPVLASQAVAARNRAIMMMAAVALYDLAIMAR